LGLITEKFSTRPFILPGLGTMYVLYPPHVGPGDASKSQLNQASQNRTGLKFGSENQLNTHNYLSILFCDFPLIVRSGKSHVTISLIGCAPHIYSKGP